jgi:hypothetical protein
MIRNGSNDSAINNFGLLPLIPNQIVMALIEDNSDEAEMFWKLLAYSQPDALEKDNLTEDEKIACIWDGDTLENEFHIFYKPLIGAALDTAQSQTQMRLYRITTKPVSELDALINFEIVFITNEKESMVRHKGYWVERTDLLETLFLSIMNGRDLGVGVGTLKYDDKLSRSCGSTLGINNSKTFYGRTLIMGLRFMSAESDSRACG